jgi:hypothetical protein
MQWGRWNVPIDERWPLDAGGESGKGEDTDDEALDLEPALDERLRKITFHSAPYFIENGFYLKTSRSGYRVVASRLVRGHLDKFVLSCLRCPVAQIPPEATTLPMKWMSRDKKKR